MLGLPVINNLFDPVKIREERGESELLGYAQIAEIEKY
jgi:hypothetical protein